MTSEKNLQDYLIKKCGFNGIYARKMQAVGHTGFPDVLLAIYGAAVFVELKSPTGRGRLSLKQEREIERMTKAGLAVLVLNSKEQVDDLIIKIIDA
jgi:hypothetical protein